MFDKNTIISVWNKWRIVPWYDPRFVRQDTCWAWIERKEYWNRNSQFWREIDHIKPVSLWGSDILSNLRPLQRQNNTERSNGRLCCPVKARILPS